MQCGKWAYNVNGVVIQQRDGAHWCHVDVTRLTHGRVQTPAQLLACSKTMLVTLIHCLHNCKHKRMHVISTSVGHCQLLHSSLHTPWCNETVKFTSCRAVWIESPTVTQSEQHDQQQLSADYSISPMHIPTRCDIIIRQLWELINKQLWKMQALCTSTLPICQF